MLQYSTERKTVLYFFSQTSQSCYSGMISPVTIVTYWSCDQCGRFCSLCYYQSGIHFPLVSPFLSIQNVRWDHIPSDNIRSGVNGYVLWSDMCDYTLQINNVTTDREGSYRCRHTDGIDDSRTLKIARKLD